jgi:hypothetical protein
MTPETQIQDKSIKRSLLLRRENVLYDSLYGWK